MTRRFLNIIKWKKFNNNNFLVVSESHIAGTLKLANHKEED